MYGVIGATGNTGAAVVRGLTGRGERVRAIVRDVAAARGADPAAMRAATGFDPARGVRLDESRSGHGLGLTIVRDIAELLGGTLAFGRSQELGGLEVRVDLPFPGDASRHGPG